MTAHQPSISLKKLLSFMVICVAVLFAVVGMRFYSRPLFASDFTVGEMELLPRWRIAPRFGGDFIQLVDEKLNMVVIVGTGNRLYSGPITPVTIKGIAYLQLSPQRKLVISPAVNSMIIFYADGASATSTLMAGGAERMEEMTDVECRALVAK